jgi:hypothetical protein
VLPETDIATIRELCEARVPPDVREHVGVELERERQAVTIVERRPPWREDYGPEWSRLPIARLRYVASKRLWTLYYHRHTGRWERYPLLGPSCASPTRSASSPRIRSACSGADSPLQRNRIARSPRFRPQSQGCARGGAPHYPFHTLATSRRAIALATGEASGRCWAATVTRSSTPALGQPLHSSSLRGPPGEGGGERSAGSGDTEIRRRKVVRWAASGLRSSTW